MKGPTDAIARSFGVEAWKVPTIAPSAAQHASSEREGIPGSCMCSTSKSPWAIHCRTLEAAIGPKRTRATEPLNGIGTGRPALTSHGSLIDSSSLTGAITET